METDGVIAQAVELLERKKRQIQLAIDALNGEPEVVVEARTGKRQKVVRAPREKKTRQRKSGGGEASEASGATRYFVSKGELVKVMTGQRSMSAEQVLGKLSAAFKGTKFTMKAVENALEKYAIKTGDGWDLAE